MSENTNTRDIEPFLLNRSEAARYLGIGINTLSKLKIPRTQIGRRVLYCKELLEKWVREQTEKTINSFTYIDEKKARE